MVNSLATEHHGISFVSTIKSGNTTVPITCLDNKVVTNGEVVKEVVSDVEIGLIIDVVEEEEEEEEGIVEALGSESPFNIFDPVVEKEEEEVEEMAVVGNKERLFCVP